MLRRSRQLRTRVHQMMDAGLFMLALWLAHSLRFHIEMGRPAIAPFDQYAWLWWVILPTAPFCLTWLGFYERPLLFSRRMTIWMILKASFVTAVVLVIAAFFYREDQLARGVLVLFGAVGFVLVVAKEMLMLQYYKSGSGIAALEKRIVLVGDQADASVLRDRLKALEAENLKVVGQLNLNDHSVADLVQLLHRHSANAVILSARHTYFGQVEQAIQACELEGVETWLVADFFKTQTFRTSMDDFFGVPMVVFRSAPEVSWQALGKQLIDYFGAILALILLSPLLAVLALLVKRGSPGPVFFRQQRCGLHGKPFVMLKFRSMVSDAEQRKHELECLNEMNGPVFKVTNDPRVTPIGQFLRKYSLDELPQLFNVLRGEMSLVGPRPLPVSEVERFDDQGHRRRLSVKPGLTCLWQISGRNNLRDFQEWVRLDLEYIDNWSLLLDLKILVRTIPVVLAGTGAK